jgi:hypothetical protein
VFFADCANTDVEHSATIAAPKNHFFIDPPRISNIFEPEDTKPLCLSVAKRLAREQQASYSLAYSVRQVRVWMNDSELTECAI